MKRDIVVVNTADDSEVYRFTENPNGIPAADDVVWVPENGDVAYYINGREFDYEANEIRLLCTRSPEISKV